LRHETKISVVVVLGTANARRIDVSAYGRFRTRRETSRVERPSASETAGTSENF